MERRQTNDRRAVHAFVSDDRREGPHDRRGAEARRLEREREQKQIERIRAYKERNNRPPPATRWMTPKRWTVLIIVLALLAALWLFI